MHRQVPDGVVCFPIPCGHGHRSVIPVTTAGSVYLAFSVESGLGRARRRREPITDWHASTKHHDGAEDRVTAPRRHRRRARGCARCERRGLGRDPPSDVGESDGGAAGSAENASETPSAGPTTNVAVPDAAWADGAHEAWTLDAGEKERTSITVVDDQLFVTTYTPESTPASMIAYSISGAEPEKQWETQMRDMEGYQRGVWGDYLIVGGELISRSDGQNTRAPWSDPDVLIVINDTAIACRKSNACEAWRSSDPASRVWSITAEGWQALLGIDGMRFDSRTNVHAGERTIIALSPKTLVDVDTGETFDLSPESYDGLMATTDGWIADKGGGEYTILSPTGEKRGTFGGKFGDERFGPTPSQEYPSDEQYRGYLENSGLSWAELRMSMPRNNTPGDTCPIGITIGNSTMNGLFRPVDSANCSRYPDAFAVSGDEKVVMAVSDVPLSSQSGIILGAWSLADQRDIDFPGLDTKTSLLHLAGPSLIIASDRTSGKIRAYAPGNS